MAERYRTGRGAVPLLCLIFCSVFRGRCGGKCSTLSVFTHDFSVALKTEIARSALSIVCSGGRCSQLWCSSGSFLRVMWLPGRDDRDDFSRKVSGSPFDVDPGTSHRGGVNSPSLDFGASTLTRFAAQVLVSSIASASVSSLSVVPSASFVGGSSWVSVFLAPLAVSPVLWWLLSSAGDGGGLGTC